MKTMDDALNRVTMYRLVVYGLAILAGLGVIFAAMGRLPFSPGHMILSLFLLFGSTYITEKLLSYLWRTPINRESWLITALILFLILPSAHDVGSVLLVLLAGFVASASKYLITWRGKHIFNPAATAAVFLSLVGLTPATWWIGSSAFWPFTVLFGLAVVWKIRRFALVGVFFAVSILLQVVIFTMNGPVLTSTMQQALLASPLIFLGTVMLTEPATMPARRSQQMIFGMIVAVLYVTAWKVGPVYIYPEVALLLGNIYAFVVSPKFKVALRLKEIQPISERIYNYVFEPQQKINFLAGQYMEWTLPHVPQDSRGNRRTFTIASSPTEDTVQIGLKYYEHPSAFKQTLRSLRIGDRIYASQLAGNFTLDSHENRKLVFIAGGIGITPFRSMIRYLVNTRQQRDIVLIYMVSDETEFAYIEEFEKAALIDVRLVLVSSKQATRPGVLQASFLDSQTIAAMVPDYHERLFYLSGPNAMVIATRQQLKRLGTHRKNIKTDYFSGY